MKSNTFAVLFAALFATTACGDSSSNPFEVKNPPASSPTDPGSTGGTTAGSGTTGTGGTSTGSDSTSTTGSDSTSTGGTTAGSDSTSTGSTDSGSTGGTDSGTTDSGSTDGSTGGTDAGSTDGGSTGSTDGGSTDTSGGTTDSGSTAGGDTTSTGGTDSGSTGGSTDGTTVLPVGKYTLAISVGTSGATKDGTVNANQSQISISYTLKNGSGVAGCGTVVNATVLVPTGTSIHQNNCDPVTGARNLVINNPTKGVAAEFEVQFSVDGSKAIFKFSSTIK